MKKGLIVFAREPLPGEVKTRLAAAIGKQAAVELYKTMLETVLKSTRQLSNIETTVFWSCKNESLPQLAREYHCTSRLQCSGDLGQRMYAAFEDMFAHGCELCCIIGSDAPDLPCEYILNAYKLLSAQQTDVVFGPSTDGGYYLLGMKELRPQLFMNIHWSTANVLRQSLTVAQASGLTTALLPEWQDIDTLDDLHAFQNRNSMKQSTDT